MTVPDYQSLMLPLLKRVAAAGRPVSVIELQSNVAGDLGLTEPQLAERLRSGRQTVFHNRLHWAKQYMTRAGLLETTRRGQFQITAEGQALLAASPAEINNRTLKRYPAFREWFRGGVAASPDATEDANGAAQAEARSSTPEERIEQARRELDAAVKAELLDRVRRMPPSEFEGLIILLLVRMGYGQGREEMAEACLLYTSPSPRD